MNNCRRRLLQSAIRENLVRTSHSKVTDTTRNNFRTESPQTKECKLMKVTNSDRKHMLQYAKVWNQTRMRLW
jgi:hypothetical protein